MIIKTLNLGKRFGVQHIIRDLNLEFSSGNSYAITGPNGSGKSTLLKLLSGILPPSKGKVLYLDSGSEIPHDKWYGLISVAAPYMDVIEDFTLDESLDFHSKFLKKPKKEWKEKILQDLKFKGVENKLIRDFSSGMKQRLKLSLAFNSDSPIVFLDEPMTNLDKQGQEWYLSSLQQKKDGILIVFSNRQEEYRQIEKTIALS